MLYRHAAVCARMRCYACYARISVSTANVRIKGSSRSRWFAGGLCLFPRSPVLRYKNGGAPTYRALASACSSAATTQLFSIRNIVRVEGFAPQTSAQGEPSCSLLRFAVLHTMTTVQSKPQRRWINVGLCVVILVVVIVVVVRLHIFYKQVVLSLGFHDRWRG